VNGVFVDWGSFKEDHVYYLDMTGDGSPLGVALWIYDDIASAYSNNTGYLTVEVYWMP
jgi:hypothetical protein